MNRNFIFKFCFLFCLMSSIIGCEKNDQQEKEKEPNDPFKTFFPKEVRPTPSFKCFPGAYYRKTVSSKDLWLGITGKIKLPTITFDESRKNPLSPAQYMDNPSIYLGGNSNGQETDIGLTWEVIRDDYGNPTPDRRAFRPFFRRAAYTPTGQSDLWENAPALPDYYFYPGEEVTLTLELVKHQTLRLTVESGKKKFEKEYICDGYKLGYPMEVKRVNAIDQVRNEGKPVQATKTKVTNAIWYNTYLLREYNNEIVKVPMHTKRFTDMRCPDPVFFNITATDDEGIIGAETITIDGGLN